MLGATETTNTPDVAPAGITMLIDVSVQELTITGIAFRVTTLPPGDAPKLEPVITTWLPIPPVVAETPVMTGADVPEGPAATSSIDTLSKVAVARTDGVPLLAANPTDTFGPIAMVWFPSSVQLTPSGDA